jgi:thiamine-monophosphate kinase
MPLTEFEIIALIREMAGQPGPGVEVSIGDDAALFHFAGGRALLTTDSMYEGVHFNLDYYDLSDVGWRAVAAGISDIAAMGGEPSCVLLSLAYGRAPEAEEVKALIGGVLEMASSYNCTLIGGDVCRSPGGLALTVTVAGTPPPTGPALRGGAHEGDRIGVTGTLGGSGAGLHVLKSGSDDLRARFPELVESHLRPRPRVQAGQLLSAAGITAMEDISDGLAPDLRHICEESQVGCEIDAAMIPMSEEQLELAREVGVEPLSWALEGGEDFELVFTAHPGHFDTAVNALALHRIPAAAIGSIKSAGEGCILITETGATDLGGKGYDHFS